MKRLGNVLMIVLGISTLALLALFVSKAVENRKVRQQYNLTQTAAVATGWAEQTIAAIPTETPLPTSTPEPTVTPTPEPSPTLEPTPTEQPLLIEGCDVAAFVSDVTVPDGTEFDPDTKFVKTWRLLNDGSCTWTSSYKLYFVSGNKMSGPDSQQLTAIDVPPGASIDVSVELRAPQEPGTYQGYWGFKNTQGGEFGVGPAGNSIYVQIKVVEP
jgi:hypothetical protein